MPEKLSQQQKANRYFGLKYGQTLFFINNIGGIAYNWEVVAVAAEKIASLPPANVLLLFWVKKCTRRHLKPLPRCGKAKELIIDPFDLAQDK